MGLLTSLFSEQRGVSVVPEDVWRSTVQGSTAAGVTVTPDKALRSSAVFACVRILAETEAMLPLLLYRRRQEGRGKDRAVDHPLYPVLHDLANPEMTSYTLRETMMGHVALRGNCFAEIEISGGGEVRALWPLRADKMQGMERRDGRLWYVYDLPKKFGGSTVRLPAERILHVRGLGNDGLWGYSPIAMARQAVGLALATEEFGARFFGNGARPGMILGHPAKLSDEAHKRLRESWETRHQGLERAHRIAILEEGMTVHEVGIAPEDAQFLETRKFQTQEIARIYRIPPHMLADLDRATFSNVEHLSLEFVVFTLMPWLVRWEQEIYRSLLTPSERPYYFARHLVTGLLRGDTKTRSEAYAQGRQWGWLSADDVRELEDMNPLPDGQGEQYMVPLNMVPAEAAGDMGSLEGRALRLALMRYYADDVPMPSRVSLGQRTQTLGVSVEGRARQGAKKRHRLMRTHLRLYEDVAGRIVRREVNDVGAAAARFAKSGGAGGFLVWVDEFYREHQGWAIGQIKPLAFSYGEQVAAAAAEEVGFERGLDQGEERDGESWPEVERFTQRYLEAFGSRLSIDSHERILAVVRAAQEAGEDWYQALVEELEAWRESRPPEIAGEEAVRFNGALSRFVFGLAGFVRFVWQTMGDNCPYCSSLDGRVVGVEEPFLGAGEEMQPDGAERPLKARRTVKHPPLHKG